MVQRRRSTMSLNSWGERLRWGLRWGFVYVVIFGGFAILLRIIDGSRSFIEHGTSLAAVLEAYLLAGFVGGTLLGVTRPWLSTKAASACVGAVVGSTVGFAFLITNNGVDGWTAFDYVLPGIFALIGLATGIGIHRNIQLRA